MGMKQIKGVLKAVCSIWLCLLLAVFSYQMPVFAAVEVDAHLTAVQLRNPSGVAMSEQTKGGYFQVYLLWNVPSTLHQGDFFQYHGAAGAGFDHAGHPSAYFCTEGRG